jgi:2'-5' RNA ligase
VEIEGDFARPRLERPKHVEYRWLALTDLDLLGENGGRDDGLVRHLAQLALLSAHPGTLTHPHATAFVDSAVASALEALRAEWDPAMAEQIAAHVTIAYPAEVPALAELVERLRFAADVIRPFRLRLGAVTYFGPDDGVAVDVDDVDGGWVLAREVVVGSSQAVDIRPHVTIVHPRTTNRAPEAWASLEGRSFAAEFVVKEITATAFDGRRWTVVERLALRGR